MSFGRSRSKRAERPSSAPHQDIEKTCNEIVDKRMVDVYKFINSLSKKRKEFVRPPDIEVPSNVIPEVPPPPGVPPPTEITPMPKALSRGAPFVESVALEEPLIKDLPIIIKKKPARKMHPLILPDGFGRKSIHEPTESSENKGQPKLIFMNKIQKVGS